MLQYGCHLILQPLYLSEQIQDGRHFKNGRHCNHNGTTFASWYHWRHLKISAGPGQRIPMEIPGYGGSLFQSTSGVKI